MKLVLILIFFIGIINTPNNAWIIWKLLKNKGLINEGSAGLMGIIMTKSGMKSTSISIIAKNLILNGLTDEEYVKKVNDGNYANFVNDHIGFRLGRTL